MRTGGEDPSYIVSHALGMAAVAAAPTVTRRFPTMVYGIDGAQGYGPAQPIRQRVGSPQIGEIGQFADESQVLGVIQFGLWKNGAWDVQGDNTGEHIFAVPAIYLEVDGRNGKADLINGVCAPAVVESVATRRGNLFPIRAGESDYRDRISFVCPELAEQTRDIDRLVEV